MDELEMIQELMDKLKEKMAYTTDDLDERLGKPKPEMEMPEMEGDLEEPGPEMEMEGEVDIFEEEEDPLKARLMKIRGK